MKRARDFFLVFLFNLLINFEWTIPAWVLLVLHFVLDLSIFWFIGAIALWIVGIFVWMSVIGWAGRCATDLNDNKKNVNPYSVGYKEVDDKKE